MIQNPSIYLLINFYISLTVLSVAENNIYSSLHSMYLAYSLSLHLLKYAFKTASFVFTSIMVSFFHITYFSFVFLFMHCFINSSFSLSHRAMDINYCLRSIANLWFLKAFCITFALLWNRVNYFLILLISAVSVRKLTSILLDYNCLKSVNWLAE